MTIEKKVYVMRGLPGSGKSYWVNQLIPGLKPYMGGRYEVCSADHHFMDSNGVYRFEASELPAAHQSCFKKFITAVANDIDVVIVDNTGTSLFELSPYVLAGESFGYSVEVVEVRTPVSVCAERNTHGVPTDTIARMDAKMRSEPLPPWWKSQVVSGTP